MRDLIIGKINMSVLSVTYISLLTLHYIALPVLTSSWVAQFLFNQWHEPRGAVALPIPIVGHQFHFIHSAGFWNRRQYTESVLKTLNEAFQGDEREHWSFHTISSSLSNTRQKVIFGNVPIRDNEGSSYLGETDVKHPLVLPAVAPTVPHILSQNWANATNTTSHPLKRQWHQLNKHHGPRP